MPVIFRCSRATNGLYRLLIDKRVRDFDTIMELRVQGFDAILKELRVRGFDTILKELRLLGFDTILKELMVRSFDKNLKNLVVATLMHF